MKGFRKKRDEIIDFSEMYKRGMIKETKGDDWTNAPEVIDFSQKSHSSSSSFSSSDSSVSNDNFDFLGGLAGAGASSSSGSGFSSSSSGSVTENLRAARQAHRTGDSRNEVNELRIKLEDTEYKLNNLINKVQELESKLSEFRI